MAVTILAQAMQLLTGTLTVDAEDMALLYVARARLQHARGEHAGARATLDAFTDLARRCGFVEHLVSRGATVQAQLALAEGNLPAAVAWVEAGQLRAANDLPFPRETEYLILARVWIAQAQGRSAGSVLQQVLPCWIVCWKTP